MRIHEVEVGVQKPFREGLNFAGQIRHFTFNGINPLIEPGYLIETPQLKTSLNPVKPAITIRTADCYLMLPRLSLYGAFRLTFSLKTHQQDGVILFNSGGGDFLAVELVRGQLTLSFDMGHGAALQHQRVGRGPRSGGLMSDGNWHQVTLSR